MSRFRRPRWRDPRLGVGVLLVAGSVALGGWLFSQADHTTPSYVARGPIAVGQTLAEADMDVVDVNLSTVAHGYLSHGEVAELKAAGAVFIHRVPAGELIPRSAVGSVTDLTYRPVSIPVTNPTPIAPGDIVDLWVMAEDLTGREAADPARVATGLHVTAVASDDSLFSATGGHLVHALVAEADLPEVLAALGSRTIITLVPQLHG